MITDLPASIAALPDELRTACKRIFYVQAAIGRTVPPDTMHPWIVKHFGDVESVREQQLVTVVNRLTLEGALFNPLRARRPSGASGDDAALEQWIADELRDDIFREPQRDTPADSFGRIKGQHCVSASNIAKYDGWHGLVVFDEPHPLRFGREQVRDYLDVACRWLQAAHAQDPQAIYPMITWNCLPKSGATLVHGHMQIALARCMPYARVELWRRAAVQYRAETKRNYFDDLADIHAALDLAVPSPQDVRAFAHLTPMRNREIVVLAVYDEGRGTNDEGRTTGDGRQATKDGRPTTNDEQTLFRHSSFVLGLDQLADALCDTLRTLIAQQNVRSFNVGIALPPLATTDEDWRDVPIIARLSDRGAAMTSRSDWGAMELYGTGCITVDPFTVAAGLRKI